MEHIVVAVSTFYNGRGWTDQATGLSFEPSHSIKPVRIKKDGKDLSGIKNSVRLNNLLLLEGDLNEEDETPREINPEELTKDQFAKLMKQMKAADTDTSKDEDIKALKDEIDALKAKIAELKKELEASEEEEEELDRQLELSDKTVSELKAIADEYALKYASSIRKPDLIDLILEAEE